MSRRTSKASFPARKRTEVEVSPRERLVIGIDYGTTFSSVAYACVPAEGIPLAGSRRIDIQPIMIWPGKTGTAELPTKTIYYNDENSRPKLEWGFGTQALQAEARGLTACHRISLAKLLLHSSQETGEETKTIRRYAAEIPKSGKELVEDFLAQLYDYLFHEDATAPGYLWESEPDLMKRFNKKDIEFVIGVPAAWTEQEQIDMVAAAGRAGFQNASRVSEPEAVATEFFADEAYKRRLEAGKTYVVCDAGGGTVDFVTFTVESLHPLRINERCVAEGVLCGSTYLDNRFRNLMKRKLQGEENIECIEAQLDNAVRMFDETCLRNDTEKEFRKSCVWLSAKELCEQVFDEILNTIVNKVQRQINESRRIAKDYDQEPNLQIEAIILAGGLSQNPYLKSKLRGYFGRHPLPEQKPISIQIRPSYNAIVARGLVHRACLHGLVSQRRSKLNYGVRTFHQYRGDEVHGQRSVAKPKLDSLDGVEYIDTIEWFLPKDQAIIEGREIVKDRVQYFRLHQTRLVKDSIVWHENVDTSKGLTLWSDRPEELTVIPFSFSVADYAEDQFEILTSRRKVKYAVIPYQIVLRIDGSDLVWTLRIRLKDSVVEHSITTNLEAEVTENRSIGSLAERQYDDVRRPLSDFPPGPMFGNKKRNIRVAEVDSNEGGGRSVRSRLSPAEGASPSEQGADSRRSGRLRDREAEEAKRRVKETVHEQTLAAMRAGLDVGGIVESIERDGTRTVTPTVSY